MASWSDLIREFDAWVESGRTATLWWRDDDAVAPTAQLARLLELSAQDGGPPLCLAVIPALARPELSDAIADHRAISVLQHGYAHVNHAPADQKKAELGDHRPLAQILQELAAGRERIAACFGSAALPVLVPPWNRISQSVTAALKECGLCHLSTYGARKNPRPTPAIRLANTHIDIMDWHDGRRFLGEAAALELAVRHLAARRQGSVDPEEATGLLTHHLVHDATAWRFVGDFVKRTLAHPAARWLNGPEVFPDP